MVSWHRINYVYIKVENRLPLRKACLVNHDAYTKFSDSDPKKCGLAFRTIRSHARSSWYYLNAFQQPFNTKYIFVPKHLKNISLSAESAMIEARFRTPRSRSHGAEAQQCASSIYCGLCDNDSAPNHFNLTFFMTSLFKVNILTGRYQDPHRSWIRNFV